jgi:hypothetical protein
MAEIACYFVYTILRGSDCDLGVLRSNNFPEISTDVSKIQLLHNLPKLSNILVKPRLSSEQSHR